MDRALDVPDLRKRLRIPWPTLCLVGLSTALVYIADRAADRLAAPRPAPPVVTAPKVPPVLEVEGHAARYRMPPQRARWSFGIGVHTSSKASANREMKALRERVKAIVTDAGVAETNLHLVATSLDATTRTFSRYTSDGASYDQDVPDGYVGEMTFEVYNADATQVIAAHLALANVGDPRLTIERPYCWIDDETTVSRELIETAIVDARRQAELLVNKLGHARLGSLIAVDHGGGVSFTSRTDPASCTEGVSATTSIKARYELHERIASDGV